MSAARPIQTAPRDGTMVALWVDYTSAPAAHPLQDAARAWTVGTNSFDHDGEDVWRFAGWCWSHDHFTEGKGKVLGWLPFMPGVSRVDEMPGEDWVILREPGCVPERKGPFAHGGGRLVGFLREVMRARPGAYITVASYAFGRLCVQDGPEALMMLDGRSRSVARRHLRTTREAHAAPRWAGEP